MLNILIAVLLGGASLTGNPRAADFRSVSGSESGCAVGGRYVEARSASVFAGACHYNGEYTTAGRSAVLVFSFEEGSHAGVAFAGLGAVVAIDASLNLADPAARRRSVLYLDPGASTGEAHAVSDWLQSHHGAQLGQLVAVRRAPLQIQLSADAYEVQAGEFLRLAGATLPDGDCCRMPFNVWYGPEFALDSALVGCSEEFGLREPLLDVRFLRRDANDAFLGRLAGSRQLAATR